MIRQLGISIIIPNRNGGSLLQKNLSSVITAVRGCELIIVDDASTDDSVDLIQREFPTIKLVQKAQHEGYASTVNAGVREASGDIVVLLNSDVRPEKNFLAQLVTHFRDPKVFAVGCMDKSIEGNTTVLRGRGLARWERGMYVHARGEVDKTDTAWVSGGSGAFRKSIWVKLDGMDEIFNPFYWEDIDLSYRAVKAGYKILFESKSVVIHEHEKGIIKQEFSPFQIKTIAYRNQFIFAWKNLSDKSVWIQHVLWTPVRTLQAVFRLDLAFIVGYIKALFLLPRVILSRVRALSIY